MAESPKADQNRKDFFVSYNKNDADWAEWIAWQLEDAGYSTHLMAWDFRPGTNFVCGMQKGATIADRTIAVLSPDYLASRFTKPEWQAAFAQDPTGEKGILLPVKVRECKPEGLLGPIVYIDLVDKKTAEAKKILLAGVKLKRAKPKTAPQFPGGKKPKESEPRFPGALPPIWNVPQRRNPNFTGREELLDQLHKSLTSGEHAALTQAIKGLGGVGKTQSAIEYAYRHAADYETVWWIRAEDTATLAADFAALATPLELEEREAKDQRIIVEAVLRKLEHITKWLLVFDNVTAPEDVQKYLPQGQTGHIIITSRYQTWRAHVSALSLDVLEPDEAVDFLLKRTAQIDREAAQKLAEELGYFPLALEQAGAYAETAAIPLTEYLELYLTRRQELWADQQPPPGYEYTVATTWAVSLDAVRKESPAALDLLNLCAFLAPDNIPLDIIRDGAKFLPDSLADTAKDQMAFHNAIGALLRYSLIKKDKDKDTISVHQLVQAVIRDRLAEDEHKKWAAAAVEIVNKAYPQESDDVRTWTDCARLLPHAQTTTAYTEKYGVAAEATARLLNQCGVYLRGRALFAEAKKNLERALAMGEAAYGKNHPATAIRLNNLGGVLRELGDLAGAKKNFERALAIGIDTFGENHPKVALRLNNLGLVLKKLGDLAGAKNNFERALAIDEAAYGKNHPDVAIDLNNLGSVLQDLGDLVGAKENYERALEIGIDTYGENHPKVALRLNNLGSVLQDLGDLVGAKENYERALEIGIDTFGENHPKVALRLNNLGSVLQASGDLAGAKKNYERALAIDEATYGKSHPSVAIRLSNLGSVLQASGNLAEAKENFVRALAIAESTYGKNHPDVAIDLGNLGGVLRALGDLAGAKKNYERALAIFIEFLGEDHPKTKTIRENLEIVEKEIKKQ